MIRFIHASDLHLGRRFANIPADETGVRGRLMEARHGAIGRIAQAARDHGAAHVLLAGDTFDTPTPSAGVVRQALAAMGEDQGVTWWLLPGNHDNLREAEVLWETLSREAPANVQSLTAAAPVAMGAAVLLPCPVAWRSSGEDATRAMPGMESAEGAVRIGLAHGGVTDFTDSGAHIPPDRDRTARLDYLALGDWHGRMAVGARVHYPGSPEQDRFRHNRRGGCLAVTVAGSGAVPDVAEVETGQFLWSEADLPLLPGQDAGAALAALLPQTGRRDVLVRLRATGRLGLAERSALMAAAARVAPDFALFDLRDGDLATAVEVADLDAIDRAGALRLAAEELQADGSKVATDALARLYAFVTEDAP
ncbi:MAG: DNA repair exonuclease [Pseudooceanicola sp.]|nr:DNA repair exonuclease [Pseudooceanicola sp.]